MLAFGGVEQMVEGRWKHKTNRLKREAAGFSRNSQTWLNAKNSNTIIAAAKNITRPVVV
jgi:hypothetical protein